MFRWITTEELQEQIEAKATSKFGTSVPDGKAKKLASRKHAQQYKPLQLDPAQLLMSPGTFSTAGGQPLAQLSFAEVKPQSTGVCFCSPQQAAPYMQECKANSVDALGLVTTAEIASDVVSLAPASNLRYPAVYAPTGEAVLIAGTLIQLGDETVQLTPAEMTEIEHLETFVVKLTLYRDECTIPWDRVAEAPLRTLINSVGELSICKQSGCKQDCGRFHPSVEEAHAEQLFLDAWGRQWQKVGGGRTDAQTAGVFQMYLRAPASALSHLHCVQFPGLYFEPRSVDGQGPHPGFAVIWLAGADADTARHSLRTCDRAIALTRLGLHYGLRVREPDEQSAFATLRPQHQFVKVRVTGRYRVQVSLKHHAQ